MRHAQPVLRRRFPLQGGVPYLQAGLNGLPKAGELASLPPRARWVPAQGYGVIPAQRPPRFNLGVGAHAGAASVETIPPPRWQERAGFGLVPPQRVPRFNYGLAAHAGLPDVVAPVRQPGRGRVSVFLRPATVNYGLPARSGPAELVQQVRSRKPGTARTYARPATFNFGVAWHADEAHIIAAWRRAALGRLSGFPAPHSAPAVPSGLPRGRVVQPAAARARGAVRTALVPRFNLATAAHAGQARLLRVALPRLRGRVVPGQHVTAAALLRRAGPAVVAWVRPRRGRGALLQGWHPFFAAPTGPAFAGPAQASEPGGLAAIASESGGFAGATANESGGFAATATEGTGWGVTVTVDGGFVGVTASES